MKIVVDRLISSLYQDNLSPKAAAKAFHVSESTVSKIIHRCKEIVDARLSKIQQDKAQLEQVPQVDKLKQSLFWIDETFFTVNEKSYALMLVIDHQGRPVTWRLTERRTLHQYQKLFDPILEDLPEPFVLIGDGLPTYVDLCKWIKKECYLIQHIHSHPWEKAKLHHFKYDEKKSLLEQISLELPYDTFMKDERVNGHTYKRVHHLQNNKDKQKKRGRPKGVTKAVIEQRKKEQEVQRKTKKKAKRGRKSLSTHGQLVSFLPQPTSQGWDITRLEPFPRDKVLQEPSNAELERLLTVTYTVMEGGYIQSNKIESKNHVIKYSIPTKGLKGKKHLETHVNNHLLARASANQSTTTKDKRQYPFACSLALKNIEQFIDYSTVKIKV